mgnify:CR=1 FL=1
MAIYCGECANDMVVKHGSRGPFLGCSDWPSCKGSYNLYPVDRSKPTEMYEVSYKEWIAFGFFLEDRDDGLVLLVDCAAGSHGTRLRSAAAIRCCRRSGYPARFSGLHQQR